MSKEVTVLTKILVNYVVKKRTEHEMGHMVVYGTSRMGVLFLFSIEVLFLPLDDGYKGVYFVIVYLALEVWLSVYLFCFQI